MDEIKSTVPGICEHHQGLEESIQIIAEKLEKIESMIAGNTELIKIKSKASEHRVRMIAAVGLLLAILAGMYFRPEVEKFWLYNVVGYAATGWLFGAEMLNFWQNKQKISAVIVGAIPILGFIAKAAF